MTSVENVAWGAIGVALGYYFIAHLLKGGRAF